MHEASLSNQGIKGGGKKKATHQRWNLEWQEDAPAGQKDADQPGHSVVWCWRREELEWFEFSLASVLVNSEQGLLLPYVPNWENK